VWTLQQAADYVKQGNWPTAGNIETDPNFENVTMLLHGDGTNGGQNNTFLDASTNNFTITRNGNTTQGSFSPYGANWSNYFDGAGDYLNFGTSSQLTLSGDFTVEGWFFVEDTASTFKRLFNNAPSTTPTGYFYVYTNGTDIRMYNVDVGVLQTVGTFSGNSVWFHLAICRSGSTTRVFVNGTQTYSYSGTTTFTNSGWYVGGGPDQEYHKGYISNHRVVVGSALYTSNFTPSTTPLTAVTNTRLLTCADNRFVDDSTNNFVPTIVGNTSVQRFSPFVLNNPGYTTATIGGSGYFDGSGDYLSVPSSSVFAFGTGNFTIEAWVYPLATYVDSIVKPNTDNLNLYINGSGFPAVYFASSPDLTGSTKAANFAWNHLAISRSSGTMRIFLNGVNIGSTSSTPSYGTMSLTVGDAGTSFNAYLSDLRIVSTALYTSNFTVPTAPISAVANTQLLLPMQNAAIFDNAMMNDLETVGNAQISTSVVKYGTGSMAFDGTGDSLTVPYSPNIKLTTGGDWTIEFWMYCTGAQSGVVNGIWMQDNAPNGYTGILIAANSSRQVQLTSSTAGTSWNYLFQTIGTYTNNTWHHVAVTKFGTTVRGFFDGTLNLTITGFPNSSYVTTDVSTLATYGGNDFNGYIDDFRLTKGVARYTANFTPPTAAFPNF
jgi:hypothetical protein